MDEALKRSISWLAKNLADTFRVAGVEAPPVEDLELDLLEIIESHRAAPDSEENKA